MGKIIDDWGGRDAYFEVAILDPPHSLVYKSRRGDMRISWAIILGPEEAGSTRVHLRLRLAGAKRKFLFETFGGLIDALVTLGLAAGLRERLSYRP